VLKCTKDTDETIHYSPQGGVIDKTQGQTISSPSDLTINLSEMSERDFDSKLLVILDPSIGEYSRRNDRVTKLEHDQLMLSRKGLDRLPVLEPLPYDIDRQFKDYSYKFKKYVQCHELYCTKFPL